MQTAPAWSLTFGITEGRRAILFVCHSIFVPLILCNKYEYRLYLECIFRFKYLAWAETVGSARIVRNDPSVDSSLVAPSPVIGTITLPRPEDPTIGLLK